MRWCKSLDNSLCIAETHRIFPFRIPPNMLWPTLQTSGSQTLLFFSPPLQNAIRLNEFLQSAARITNCFWTKISATAVQRRQVLYRASASFHGKIQAVRLLLCFPNPPTTNNDHVSLLFCTPFPRDRPRSNPGDACYHCPNWALGSLFTEQVLKAAVSSRDSKEN